MFRIGRMKLLEMSFADFETRIRDELDRMLGPAASPARATSRRSPSIAGRTAIPMASNSLFDPADDEDL